MDELCIVFDLIIYQISNCQISRSPVDFCRTSRCPLAIFYYTHTYRISYYDVIIYYYFCTYLFIQLLFRGFRFRLMLFNNNSSLRTIDPKIRAILHIPLPSSPPPLSLKASESRRYHPYLHRGYTLDTAVPIVRVVVVHMVSTLDHRLQSSTNRNLIYVEEKKNQVGNFFF